MDSNNVLPLAVGLFLGVSIVLSVHRLQSQTAPAAPDRPRTDRSRRKAGVVNGIEGCIGNTPLVRIKSLSDATGCEILGKAEFMNGAGGSPKDRVAARIIKEAEERGDLIPYSGDTIYEGTAGSTGISLATLARAKGYLTHIFMFEDQAIEKSDLLEKLGAKVERLKNVPITHPDHFTNRARIQASKHAADAPGGGRGFFADQFDTDANWRAHFEGTGPEIFEQTDGCIDAFVAGAGTGGIISGVALYLKPRLPKLKVLLADPEGSGLLNRVKFGLLFDPTEKEGTRRRHQINSIVEGIGVNVITGNFEAGGHLIDDAIRVTDNQALAIAKWLVEKDGMFLGSSSAVNCFAAVKVAQALGPGHTIVTILCDSGARHLSKFWKIAGSVVDRSNTRLEDVMSTS